MIKLLQVELHKIFKRKSIYVIWGIMLIFCLLNNILYYTDYDDDGNYKYLEQEDLKSEQIELMDELSKYNQNNANEATIYITIKTKLDILELKQKFSQNSWQYKKINTYLYDIIYKINYYVYIEKNLEQSEKYQTEYKTIIINLNNNNYEYFLEKEINATIENQEELKKIYYQTQDEKEKQELKLQIEENKNSLKILNYRLKNNIKEDNSYLNNALENYQINYANVKYYENLADKKTYQDKLNYQEALSDLNISKYIIEHQQNINKQNNLNYQLRTIIEDYEIFIIILILIVCSSIICDEFKSGTIKLLLIKPYSRGKILLSKYFASIIVIAVSILILIAMQLIIGSIIFGIDSLEIPVVIYDFNKSNIVEYHVIHYMMIRIAATIPFLVTLVAISFLIGVLTASAISSITMPLMIYMVTPTIRYLAIQYQLEFMKYLVNVNWNLQDYLFGKLSEVSFIKLQFSIVLLATYLVILLILTFVIFKKKNIKNI